VQSFLRRAAVGLLSLAALSCASGSVFQLSLEEQVALREAMDTPLDFVVPRERSIASWDRAREFIDRYSTMKLRSTTDSVLVSYDSPMYSSDPPPSVRGSNLHYGYSIVRSRDPAGGGTKIAVQGTSSSDLGKKDAEQNAHIAAYYILTGYLGCARCVVR